jgi:hypothetical protein
MIKSVGQVNHNLLVWRYNNVGSKSSQNAPTSVTSVLCTSNFTIMQWKFMSAFLNWSSREWSMDLTNYVHQISKLCLPGVFHHFPWRVLRMCSSVVWTAYHILCYLISTVVTKYQHIFSSAVVKSLSERFQPSYKLPYFRIKNQSHTGKKWGKVDVKDMKACRENTGITHSFLPTELHGVRG